MSELVRTRADSSLIVRLKTIEKTSEKDVITWDEFRRRDSGQDRTLLEQYWAKSQPSDTLCVQFTSGTTGPRKAAMLSHQYVYGIPLVYLDIKTKVRLSNLLSNAWLVGQRLEYTPEDVICCCAPLFHCFALVCGIIAPLMYGSVAVIPSDVFLAGASLEALSGERCTVIHAVGTMLQALLDHPDASKHAPKLHLRTGIVAGSSLSHILIQRLADEFGFTGLAYGYGKAIVERDILESIHANHTAGMTEASCIVYLTEPSKTSLLADHSSVGTLLPHSSARVVDSNLRPLPPGSPGELIVSGYLVFKGYYKNKAKTEEALIKDDQRQTWLRTGDLVVIDAAGRCIITGRVKDMIKRGKSCALQSLSQTLFRSNI